MSKSMPELTFAQIVKIFKNNTQLTQFEIIHNLLTWITNTEKIPEDELRISPATASRYAHGENIKVISRKIQGQFDKEKFENNIQKMSKISLSKLRDTFVEQGFDKNIYPSDVANILYEQLTRIITNADTWGNSSKLSPTSSNYPISKAIKKDPKRSSNQYKLVASIFNKRFHDDFFKQNFSVLVTHQDPVQNTNDSFTISKSEWESIKENFMHASIIIFHFIYTHDDKSRESPFGPFANYEFPNQIPHNADYQIVIDNDGKEVYADTNGQYLTDINGNNIKALRQLREINPAIPSFAYICEITSFKESPNNDKVKITFEYHRICKIDFMSLVSNHELFGVPKRLFYSQENTYEFFPDIDFIQRLKQVININNVDIDPASLI